MTKKQTYYIFDIGKYHNINRIYECEGEKTPQEIKDNIYRLKSQRDTANKSCVFAVVPEERFVLPQDNSREAHLACTISLLKQEEVYYIGRPIDKNNQYTDDTTQVAGVKIGLYTKSDFKPGDYIIHEKSRELYLYSGQAHFLSHHKGVQGVHTGNTTGRSITD